MTSLADRLAAIEKGGNAVYGDLKSGDHFRFPERPGVVYVKAYGDWFTRKGSQFLTNRFTTRSSRAVVKLSYTTGGPK